jgi:PAS domain S-box-containing protein
MPRDLTEPSRFSVLAVFSTVVVIPSFFLSVEISQGLAILASYGWVLLASNLFGFLILGLILESIFRIVTEGEFYRKTNDQSRLARGVGGIGIWEYDPEGDRFLWDSVQSKIFGADGAPKTMAEFHALLSDHSEGSILADFERARKNHERWDRTLRIRSADGGARYIRSIAEFVPNLDNLGGAHVLGISIDVTHERELNLDLMLKSAALDAATNGVLVTMAEEDHKLVYVNRAFLEMTGYDHDEVIGRNCRFLNAHDRDQEQLEVIRQALKAGTACSVTLRNRRKDGTPFWNQLRIAPIFNADRVLTHFVGIQTDVTRDIEGQEALATLRDHFEAVLRAVPDAILTVSATQRIEMVNEAAEKLFGWNKEDLIGAPVDVLVPQFVRGRHGALVHGYIADPRSKAGPMTSKVRIVQAVRRDGSTFPAMVSLARFEVGGKVSVAVSAHDMTEIMTANEQLSTLSEDLKEKLQQAEEANNAKLQFLMNMSHELRTPLNAIIGFSEMLKTFGVKALGDAKVEAYAADIYDSGSQLLDLINDILEISKIETSTVDLADEHFLISEVIERALKTIHPIAERYGVSVEARVDADLILVADRRSTHQCLLNLLSNAVKFSASGSAVLVEAVLVNKRPVISVQDRGPGMSRDMIEKIGEPFLRRENAMLAEGQGAGLGLAITKRLMRRMGGQLVVETEQDAGSKFSLVFARSLVGESAK